MQNLGDIIDQVSENIEVLETALHDAGIGTDLVQKDVGVQTDAQLQQSLRDLERVHQFIGTMSGQIKVSTAKISERERDTVVSSREDGVQIDEARITEINNEIKKLREQHDLQTEHINRDFLPSVKSQFARKRETVNTILYSDRTLGEKNADFVS